MRKLIVLVMGLLLVSMSAYARDIEAGTVQMSGATDARYESSTVESPDGSEGDVWQLQFDLAGTYHVIDNFGLGIYFRYAQTGVEDAEIKSYAFGPIALYNYSLGETMSLFAKASAGMLTVDAPTIDKDGWEYELGGGVRYFLTRHISLDTGVVYNGQEWDVDGVTTTDSQVAVEIGLSVYFGN